MTRPTLPARHHFETLTVSSPAVVLGQTCAVTGERLRPGQEVVVCDAVYGAEPITVEGWLTLAACPHCSGTTGLAVAYVPPVWAASGTWATTPPAPPSPPANKRSGPWIGALAALLLLAAGAILVAVILFALRTRQPAAAGQPATAAAGTPVAETVATADGRPPRDAATGVGVVPSPTPPPSKTPGPPTPTLAAPTPVPLTATPVAGGPPLSPITALILIDPVNDRAVRALSAVDSIDMSREGLTSLSFRADFGAASVGSIVFEIDRVRVSSHGNSIENNAPFALGGDNEGDYYADWNWESLLGEHVIWAIACSEEELTGVCYQPYEVRLTVTR